MYTFTGPAFNPLKKNNLFYNVKNERRTHRENVNFVNNNDLTPENHDPSIKVSYLYCYYFTWRIILLDFYFYYLFFSFLSFSYFSFHFSIPHSVLIEAIEMVKSKFQNHMPKKIFKLNKSYGTNTSSNCFTILNTMFLIVQTIPCIAI